MHLKMSSGKWRPFCLGLNVLRNISEVIRALLPLKWKTKLISRPGCHQIITLTIVIITMSQEAIMNTMPLPCELSFGWNVMIQITHGMQLTKHAFSSAQGMISLIEKFTYDTFVSRSQNDNKISLLHWQRHRKLRRSIVMISVNAEVW